MRYSYFAICAALSVSACDQLPNSLTHLSEGSEQANAKLAQAEKFQKEGNFAGAEPIYRQLAERPDMAVTADLALGSMYRKIDRPQDAVAVLRDAQKHEAGNPVVLTQLGYALIDADQPEEAVNVFDQLIAMQPGNATNYNAKAAAFDHAGNHFAAQEIYQKALSVEPNSISVRNNLAMSYILNGQTNEAISLLESLSKQQPNNSTIRQNLALAYGIKGNTKKALELNLKDLSPEQAQENLRFYKEYARTQAARKKNEMSPPPPELAPSAEPVEKTDNVMPSKPTIANPVGAKPVSADALVNPPPTPVPPASTPAPTPAPVATKAEMPSNEVSHTQIATRPLDEDKKDETPSVDVGEVFHNIFR